MLIELNLEVPWKLNLVMLKSSTKESKSEKGLVALERIWKNKDLMMILFDN